MAVEIIGDQAGLLEPREGDCVVAAVADYVPAVRRIKGAVTGNQALRVLVRDVACAVWLERLAASYDGSVVRYASKTVRDVLGERWRTQLPEDVSDEAILASGFLGAEIVPRSGQSYQEIVLEHYWGEFFTLVRFPLRLAGELIDSLEPARWTANRERPLAMQALRACQERWLGQASQRERELVRAVFASPGAVKGYLGRYKILRGYPPQLGQTVLAKWYTLFKNLDIDPTPVALEDLDLSDAIREIQYYLNGLAARTTSEAELEAVLEGMSGWLVEEFEWVAHQLRDKGSALNPSPALLRGIEARFQPIRDEIAAQLADLGATVPPVYPPDPGNNHTARDWLDWAVKGYLPYRFWLEENDRWDETVARYATRYAEWFYEQYTGLRYQHQGQWVHNALNEAMLSLKAGRKVLIIVMDNFNFKHVQTLRSQLDQRGFRLVGEAQPMWAPIPTTTEVSKWCLVAGEPELSEVQGATYEDILDKDWRGHLEGYTVAYLPRLGDLGKRQRFSEDLILLNYLPVDEVLHKDERQIATTHTAEIRGYLAALAQEVAGFAKRARVERELDIYVASDHGSTKIPATIHTTLDDKFYRERAQDRHHRYIAVPAGRAANPTDYDLEHCYIVRADAFGTRESYFIAKGYDRFLQTEESIYVHGGLTPEETIVPFCLFRRTEIEVRQPTIHLPDNVIRYSVKATPVFAVGNPNDYEMRDVELNVVESDLPGVSVGVIPAGIALEVAIPVRIRRRPGAANLEAITVEGSFELQGQRTAIEPTQIPVVVRSLAESKTEFDFGV